MEKELKNYLNYDSETGIFTWIKQSGHKNPGDIAGHLDILGYISICFKRKRYKAHRLAFYFMTGSLPEQSVDHINGIKNDNRWVNLRNADHYQNAANKKIGSGKNAEVPGVCFHKRKKKWMARIMFKGKRTQLGYFSTKAEAFDAYKKAHVKCNGEFSPWCPVYKQ